jgi:hypothetical protein
MLFSFFGPRLQRRLVGEVALAAAESSKQENVQVQENEKRGDLQFLRKKHLFVICHFFNSLFQSQTKKLIMTLKLKGQLSLDILMKQSFTKVV